MAGLPGNVPFPDEQKHEHGTRHSRVRVRMFSGLRECGARSNPGYSKHGRTTEVAADYIAKNSVPVLREVLISQKETLTGAGPFEKFS